jgi:lipopolysaccharide biosynthesis regulator YciM
MELNTNTQKAYDVAQSMRQRADEAFEGGFATKAKRMYLRSSEIYFQAGHIDRAEEVNTELETKYGKDFWI